VFNIGGDNAGEFLNGDIAELMVYDRALAASELEILNLYFAQKYDLGETYTQAPNSDLNYNQIPDLLELKLGLNPTSNDSDDDGISNLEEIRHGTDPLLPDTDRDGVDDGIDAYALDPSRSSPIQPANGDLTPPVITLGVPANATPLP
jgi:hypothetical protein